MARRCRRRRARWSPPRRTRSPRDINPFTGPDCRQRRGRPHQGRRGLGRRQDGQLRLVCRRRDREGQIGWPILSILPVTSPEAAAAVGLTIAPGDLGDVIGAFARAGAGGGASDGDALAGGDRRRGRLHARRRSGAMTGEAPASWRRRCARVNAARPRWSRRRWPRSRRGTARSTPSPRSRRAGAREARRRSTPLLAAGRDPGPLAGVPFAVKNLYDVAGLATIAGSRIDREPRARGQGRGPGASADRGRGDPRRRPQHG